MGTPTYALNMSNVQAVADEMRYVAQYIRDLLDELDKGSIASLSEWTSSARDAYTEAKAKWDIAIADMSVQAVNAQASLAQITDNYAQAEYQGLGLWS